MKLSELPLHHAILITHEDRAAFAQGLWAELSPNPEHRFFNQTVLDIETSREIISWAQTPFNNLRVALISFASAGIPAQNALLKVLEDPHENTRFILITSSRTNLLDTVLSRLHHVHIGIMNSLSQSKEFLSTASSSRMKLGSITELLTKTDEEGRKDREQIKKFILNLAETLKDTKADARYLIETMEIASYASDPSASGKALLEYLALLLPVIK